MQINDALAQPAAAASRPSAGPEDRQPTTPKEAAEQFEQILLKQFVDVMTKGMFKTTLSGDKGPGWMKSQRNTQRDMMADILSNHLAKSGAINLSEHLMQEWNAAPGRDAAPMTSGAASRTENTK